MTNNINIAKQGLYDLKNEVIGLVKNQDRFDLVVSESENGVIDTVTITEFGAVHFNYCFPTSYGTIKMFPNNKNMNQMLDNPFEFDAFVKSFS